MPALPSIIHPAARVRHERSVAAWIAALLAGGAPGAALAAPGNSAVMPGSAQAVVVDPGRLVAREFLRFGSFTRPTAAGDITITPANVMITTGQLTANAAIPQAVNGRGPAEFDVYATSYRAFVTLISNNITISNGAATMQVRNFTGNIGVPRTSLDVNGYYRLKIGGTLKVNANQAVGTYSGTFNVTVIYQ